MLLSPPRRSPVTSTTAPTVQDEAPLEIADFSFGERNGGIVSKSDLVGKVWVGSFIYTHCTGPCPSVAATLARLQSELKLTSEPSLRIVTFTLDPGRDTPDRLKQFADNYRADKERWLFLTGKESELYQLSEKSFKISAARSKLANPPLGQEINHDTWLVVVDKKGCIRDHYDGWCGEHDKEQGCVQFEAGLKRLKEKVAELLKE